MIKNSQKNPGPPNSLKQYWSSATLRSNLITWWCCLPQIFSLFRVCHNATYDYFYKNQTGLKMIISDGHFDLGILLNHPHLPWVVIRSTKTRILPSKINAACHWISVVYDNNKFYNVLYFLSVLLCYTIHICVACRW